MIKVEMQAEKPIAVQVQEAVHILLSATPLAGALKGRDAFSPYISEHGTWMCWNDASSQWIDTGVKVAGSSNVPGTNVDITAESICTALGYTPVGSHTHTYDELTNKPQIPVAPVQDIRVGDKSLLTDNGIVYITHELIMSLIDDGNEVEY